MAEEDNENPIAKSSNSAPLNPIGSWSRQYSLKQKVKEAELGLKLGRAEAEGRNLQAEILDAQGRVVQAQAQNADTETLRRQGEAQGKAALNEIENKILQQEIDRENMRREAEGIQSRHDANAAEEKTRKLNAETAATEAEAKQLRAQIDKENARREVYRIQHEREAMRDEALAEVTQLESELASLRQDLETLDTTDKRDEATELKRKSLNREIDSKQAQLANSRRRAQALE